MKTDEFKMDRQGIKCRSIVEGLHLVYSGWHRLVPLPKGRTRLISLPMWFYTRLGFSGDDELEGKWILNNRKLILKIRKINISKKVV